MKKNLLVLTSVMALSSWSFANSSATSEELQKNREAVKAACSQEITQAGCSDKEIGKGLMKCVFKHKKQNKEFQVSESCKTAMKDLRKNKHAHKKKA